MRQKSCTAVRLRTCRFLSSSAFTADCAACKAAGLSTLQSGLKADTPRVGAHLLLLQLRGPLILRCFAQPARAADNSTPQSRCKADTKQDTRVGGAPAASSAPRPSLQPSLQPRPPQPARRQTTQRCKAGLMQDTKSRGAPYASSDPRPSQPSLQPPQPALLRAWRVETCVTPLFRIHFMSTFHQNFNF